MKLRNGSASTVVRIASSILLVAASLFYLQFGLQAMWHFLPQGILAITGALALGWAGIRTIQKRLAALIVFVGTVPIFLLHGAMTLIEPGELPFLIGSAPVPLLALAWLTAGERKSKQGDPAVGTPIG